MNVMHTAAMGVGGAAVAAIIAGAATSGSRPIAPAPTLRTPAIELRGAELEAEIERLRSRLRPAAEPQQPARNLFRFRASPGARADSVAPAPTLPAAAGTIAAPPPLSLVGMAEEPGPDGPVRTAILSGSGGLYHVRIGERVTSRYRVAAISATEVTLTDLADGATLLLTLP